ncbi:MAG: hypothetical protein MK105_02420 [Crocinitomicaceae bacterium]|nr:hypothetical protein [Crocinitomicaceae bacterium]
MVVNCMKFAGIFFILVSSFTFAKEFPCGETFVKGEYVLVDSRDDEYYMVRKKNKQIEYFNHGKSKVVSKVKWLNGNTYLVYSIKYYNAPKSWEQNDQDITVTIVDCEGGVFNLKVQASGKDDVYFKYKLKGS